MTERFLFTKSGICDILIVNEVVRKNGRCAQKDKHDIPFGVMLYFSVAAVHDVLIATERFFMLKIKKR